MDGSSSSETINNERKWIDEIRNNTQRMLLDMAGRRITHINKPETRVNFDADQASVLHELVDQYMEMAFSQNGELSIVAFGTRQVDDHGRLITQANSVFPVNTDQDVHGVVDLNDPEVNKYLLDLIGTQKKFGREIVALLHTHPKNAPTSKRENFSTHRDTDDGGDEKFYEAFCLENPGVAFGLIYPKDRGYEMKLCDFDKTPSNPSIIQF